MCMNLYNTDPETRKRVMRKEEKVLRVTQVHESNREDYGKRKVTIQRGEKVRKMSTMTHKHESDMVKSITLH